MKYPFLMILTCMSIFISSASSCNKEDESKKTKNNMPLTKIKITVNLKTFTATLSDNPTATAFKALLPLTFEMKELNGNEKYYDFSASLPTKASSNPGIIQSGDLMLYGSNMLVLFYQPFSTSYSYTKVGSITNATGLAAAVGSGNVTVAFELE